jgi:hypothetical protein
VDTPALQGEARPLRVEIAGEAMRSQLNARTFGRHWPHLAVLRIGTFHSIAVILAPYAPSAPWRASATSLSSPPPPLHPAT